MMGGSKVKGDEGRIAVDVEMIVCGKHELGLMRQERTLQSLTH